MAKRPYRRSAPSEPWLASGPSENRPWTAREFGILSAITILATAARLFRVEIWPFTAEEVVTWRAITNGLGTPFHSLDAIVSGHPLVVALMRWLLELGVLSPRGEGWLRLPFVFVGITAVPLLAVVVKKFVGSAWVALFAALLLAVHPWHIASSQAAAPVGFATTFALAALATSPVGGGWSWWRVLAAAVAATLAVGCDPAGFLVLPMLVARLADRRGEPANAAVTALRVVAVAVAVVGPAIALRWTDPGWGDAVTSGVAWFGFVANGRWLLLAFAAASFVAVRPLPILVALPALLTVVSLGVATVTGAPLHSADFLPLLPLLVALAAVVGARSFTVVRDGGVGIGRSGIAAAALVPLALLVSLLVDTALYATVYRGQRPAWRDARDLATAAREARRDVVVGAASGWPSLVFYLRPNHWRAVAGDPHPGMRVERLQLERPAAALAQFLEDARGDDHDRGEVVLLVLTEAEFARVDGDPEAKELLARSFRRVDVIASAFHGGVDTLHVLRAIRD